jgi:cytochrome P450
VKRNIDPQFVVGFDHHSHEAQHSSEVWNELRHRCPVAWNPRYGGYWMVTDYENVAEISRDDETSNGYRSSKSTRTRSWSWTAVRHWPEFSRCRFASVLGRGRASRTRWANA